ncbi:hypothetical protein [Streptomyces canus]|uniref:hypothetical protein n=1 Tax=Streptomyces canus TaxID=58343 RepID=UPI00371C8651
MSPYAAPARAEDLSRLPRTYIDTGSAEGFRDEILIYAGRLSEAVWPESRDWDMVPGQSTEPFGLASE